MTPQTDSVEAMFDLYSVRAMDAGVPEHLIDGLALYIARGIRPGGFLEAVISNDSGAFSRVDVNSRHGLFALVSFLYNSAPSTCWGSPLKFQQWIDTGGMAREERS